MTNCYRFISGPFGNSKFTEEGDCVLHTFGIDNFFADKADKPTFIKIDLKGAERVAIDGVSNILKNNKPKLAIGVSNSLKDMYDLPRHILYHNPEYKLTLRHYSSSYMESVCHGI